MRMPRFGVRLGSPLSLGEGARRRPELVEGVRARLSRPVATPIWVLPTLLIVTSVACAQGTYPFDYFSEMHYQASIKFQEPPRKLPPAGSVTYEASAHPEAVQSWRNVRGGEVNFDFAAAANLRNPVPRTPDNLDRSKKLFQVNCAMCHGPEGKGDGVLVRHFQKFEQQPPRDLSQQQTKSRTDGQVFWIISNGLGNMPAWKALLTEDERWLLTHFVRAVQWSWSTGALACERSGLGSPLP